MPNTVFQSNGKALVVSDAKSVDGSMSVVRGYVAGTVVGPMSELVLDLQGASVGSIDVDSAGVTVVEYWISKNSPDPVSEGDHSNVKWRYIGRQVLGMNDRKVDVPHGVLCHVSQARYLRIKKVRGADMDAVHFYAV